MMENAWLIPLFPFVSFIVLLVVGKQLKERSAYVGMLLTLLSLVFALGTLYERWTEPTYKQAYTWLTIGDVHLTVGFEVNALNALMLVVVSLVSFLVHTYAKGYMHGDERFPVFYAYLGLFTFAMLGLVVSPNLLQTYIFGNLSVSVRFYSLDFIFTKKKRKLRRKSVYYDAHRGRWLIDRHDFIVP